MGNCNNTKENPYEEVRIPTKNDYNMLYVIGRGGFGKVKFENNNLTNKNVI